jgi:hypothetical protein
MKYRESVRIVFLGGIAAVAASLCFAPLFAQTPSTAALPSGPGSLAGIWQSGGVWQTSITNNIGREPLGSLRTPERDRVLKTIDGKWPPLQPWAAELLEKRIGLSQLGDPYLTNTSMCLPGVPVMMLGGPYPIQILETPGLVTILLEEQNHFRLVHMNGKHPEDPDPTFLGHSVGHWEGGALVVDTIGLTERTSIDRVGIPHSADLRLIERFRRTGKDTMELVISFDDPKTFTAMWQAKVNYRSAAPGVEMTEYICENNRDIPDGGATSR